MNDLEKELAALPLAAPSAELDRRLDVAFAAARLLQTSEAEQTHPALSGTRSAELTAEALSGRGPRQRPAESPLPRGVARSDGVCDLTDVQPEISRPAPIATPWWSLAALGVAGAAAALALLLHSPPPPAPQVVFRFEAQGALRQLLLDPPVRRAAPPPIVVRVNPS